MSTVAVDQAAIDAVGWTVVVTETLPSCPSTEAAWTKIATQTRWGEWRTPSKMRSDQVVTTLVPPAVEPLQHTGDEYRVQISSNGWCCTPVIWCRVIESSSSTKKEKEETAVFDATGVMLGGMIKARFRFTFFLNDEGVVTGQVQEKIQSFLLPWLLLPPKDVLEEEHRHTLHDLNQSFNQS